MEGRSLARDFVRFVIPSIAAQWIYALYNMVDGYFVARGVSELALSSVTIASPFISLLFSVALCFAVGSSTRIATDLGRGETENANRTFTLTLKAILVISVLITVGVLLYARPIGYALGAGEQTIENTATYLRIVAVFGFFFIVSYTLEVLIKTDGYPMRAVVIVTLGCIVNAVLDYLLVIVWKRGVKGAAFATGFSQFCVVILYAFHFASRRSRMKLVRSSNSYREIPMILRLGFSSGITEFSAGIVVWLYNRAINATMGENYIICYTVVGYVHLIIVMTMVGIAQGVQPLVSYYHGKRETNKYKRLFCYALLSSFGVGLIAFVWARTCSGWLTGLYIGDSLQEIANETKKAFGIFAYTFALCGLSIITGGYFTALEYPVPSMLISLGRGFVFVAIALLCAVFLLPNVSLWYAALWAETACLVLTICLWIRYIRTIRQ